MERLPSQLPYHHWRPGPQFNIKMASYQYRKFHCGYKTVVRSSYLRVHNGISYTGKMTSLYWISPQEGCQRDSNQCLLWTTQSHWLPSCLPLCCKSDLWQSSWLDLCHSVHTCSSSYPYHYTYLGYIINLYILCINPLCVDHTQDKKSAHYNVCRCPST